MKYPKTHANETNRPQIDNGPHQEDVKKRRSNTDDPDSERFERAEEREGGELPGTRAIRGNSG